MNPADPFNFAEHLFALNRGRVGKTAYVDDHGTLSYGQLEDRARRLGAALLAAGVRRDDRALLLMLDGCDWPVSFLGCLYAGIVPVAVNTLLTAADYAYMLEHSGATAALASGALLPVLQSALAAGAGPDGPRRLFVSHPVGCPMAPRTWSRPSPPAHRWPSPPAARRRTLPSGSIPPAPPAGPRARCTPMPTPGGPPSSTASRCWA
jgi:benzoate-CoA ligase